MSSEEGSSLTKEEDPGNNNGEAGLSRASNGSNADSELASALEFEPPPLEDLDLDVLLVDNPGSPAKGHRTQSLEEILDEEDDGQVIDDEDDDDDVLVSPASRHFTARQTRHASSSSSSVPHSLLDTLSLHSKGSNEVNRSKASKSSAKSRRSQQSKKEKKGAIMRHVILKGISSQMVSANDRVSVGLPTVMATTHLYIAVGTTRGFVLVFDGKQVLKCSLGGSSYGKEYGAVSSMSFNPESTRILVGFAKGHLLEYDVVNAKLMLSLNEAHPLGSAIIHTKYSDDPSLALICDAGGSVFEVSFKRMMGIRNYGSRCIFSGSRGEVCALEPLSLVAYPDHSLGSQIIVAMATISKVIVLSLRPSMKVLFTHPLTGRADTLPIIAWQFVIIQTTLTDKVVDPVIAFGRQSSIFFYQLTENTQGKTVFVPLQKLELNYDILNFGWMNTRCLAIMDTTEGFHLQDVRNQDDLEVIDLSEINLVYGSSFFKGLATGGNVSKAMSVAGERSTYGSFMAFTNQVLLLGNQSFHVLAIRTWNERLDHLIKENRYRQALALGAEFYQDHGKTLVGLKGPKEKKKELIAEKLLSILLKFLDVSMTKNFPLEGDVIVLSEYFEEVVPPCVNTCMALRRRDVLFGNVWDTYCLDPFAKGKFLESLEIYILSDQLRNIPVNISQEFVSHYQTIKRFEALEACLTHMLVTSIDIHQAMSLCWLHGLYDAIIYIHNNGMLDYVSPMEEFMTQLTSAISASKTLSQQQIDLGNKILVYISCCLAGRAYPHGDVPKDRVAQVKYDVYTCLTALHTKKCLEDEQPYPYLRTLLHFDTQGLLNVISIAFDEPEFNTETGRCQKQRLVDILLKLMVDGEGYSPSQIGHLFTFLARQIAKGDKCFQVSRDLFEKVLEVLTDNTEKAHHEEREQALLEMLNVGGIQYFNRERLIFQAQKVGFNRILEMLYESNREYEKMLRCFIDDNARQLQAFAFIQRVMLNDTDYDGEAKGQVEKSVIRDLEMLIQIDVEKTAMVIYHHMYSYIPLVIAKLEDKREHLYKFLWHVLEHKDRGSAPSTPVHNANLASYVDPLATDETLMRFVDLMCEFDAKRVPSFLKGRSNFEVQPILELCQKHKNIPAVAYLLEKDGRASEAFDLMKEQLDEKLADLSQTDGMSDSEEDLFWARINTVVILLIQLCQRANSTLSESQRELMWFNLLESLMKPQRSGQRLTAKTIKQAKEAVTHIVNSSIGYVPLRTVIEKILQDPIYQAGNFGDIKDFLVEMMEMYHYEDTLLSSSVQLVQSDLHQQVLNRQAESRRGISSRDLGCDLCRSHLAHQGGHGVVFRCRHKYHLTCLSKAGCVLVTDLGEEKWHCYKCVGAGREARASSEATSDSQTQFQLGGKASLAKVNLGDDEIKNITNQNIVKAKAYVDNFRTSQGPLAMLDKMSSDETGGLILDDNNEGSIFDRPDFKLNLWPSVLPNS